MPKKIGICINFGGCDKARAKEKQEVEATNFVCEKCGKPLRESGPEAKGPNKAVIGGIAAVVVLGAVGAYLALSGGGSELQGLKLNKTSFECIVGGVDTLKVSNDPTDASATYVWSTDNESVATVNNGLVTMVGEGDVTITVKAQENETLSVACTYKVAKPLVEEPEGGDGDDGPKVLSLDYASYDGPMSGGKPHGIGGTLTIKKNHSIDLKDAKGGMLDVNPGDKIVNTKFTNGKLNQGELQRKNGERNYFVIG